MSDQQSSYKVTITWASDNAKVEKEIDAWGLAAAGESAVREVWCGENGERGEDQAIVEVSPLGGSTSNFYDVDVEPELDVSIGRIEPEEAAETLARWAEANADFKAKMAEREAAKSPRERLIGVMRRAKGRTLTPEELNDVGALVDAVANGPEDTTSAVDFRKINAACRALHKLREATDQAIAAIDALPADQSTSSPVSASTI